MAITVVEICGKELKKRKLRLAFVESATAGRLCSEFSLVKDAGDFLMGGLVCYDAGLKQDILGVPRDIIKNFTAESEEVTEELARRLPQLISADIHIAITGLTTPGGSETPEKPVGTMFIHMIFQNTSFKERKLFRGDAEKIVLQTVETVAEMILRALGK